MREQRSHGLRALPPERAPSPWHPENFEDHHLEPHGGPHGGSLVVFLFNVVPLVEDISNRKESIFL